MTISFLSGAYKNGGDFLIEARAIKLLKYVYPEAKIHRFLRNTIAENIDQINASDCIVFGGGPIYLRELDGYLPLRTCLEKMTKPVVFLGGGWYGRGSGNAQVHGYIFSQPTVDFLRRADKKGGGLSCRDLMTFQILKAHGLDNVFMTGCPAWYDLDYVDSIDLRSPESPHRIVISDPAQKVNRAGCVNVVKFIVERYPEAEITFAFHRGTPENSDFAHRISETGVKVVDISGGEAGFRIYDDCDLHIGYRVHAHIYNLSVRHKTVLIEEDGRGAGVDQALGLPGIKAYADTLQMKSELAAKIYKRTPFYENKYLVKDLQTYLQVLEATDWQYVRNAIVMQRKYFDSMLSFIRRIETMV